MQQNDAGNWMGMQKCTSTTDKLHKENNAKTLDC